MASRIPVLEQSVGVSVGQMPRAQNQQMVDPLGQTMEGLAHGVAVVGREMDIAAKRRDGEIAKAWLSPTLSGAEIEARRHLSELYQTAPEDGSGVVPKLLDAFDKQTEDIVSKAPNEAAKTFAKEHRDSLRTRLADQALNFEATQGMAWRANQYLTGIDNAGKLVMQDPSKSNFLTQMATQSALIDSAEIAPAERIKLKNNLHQTLTNAAAATVMDRDPYAVQDATSKAMGHNGFTGQTGVPWVDSATPEQVKVWNSQATAKIKQLENEQARKTLDREKVAQDLYSGAVDLSNKGQYFSQSYQSALLQGSKGTVFEKPVLELIESQRQSAGFASAPAAARAAALNNLRADGATPAQGTSPGMHKGLEKLEAIDSAIDSAIKDNPWQAAQKYGVVQQAPVVNLTSVTEVVNLIGQRSAQSGQVEQWAGRPISPLQPEEAEQFARILRAMPPEQAATALSQIGARAGSQGRIAALASQIKDRDGVIGLAMAYSNYMTTLGRPTAEFILRGDQAIKDKLVKPDGEVETGWRGAIAKEIRGAYSNREVEDQVINAAFLIAAAKGGDTDNAINLASGGIVNFNGSKVPLPYGMKGGESAFKDKIKAVTTQNLEAQTPGGTVKAGSATMPVSEFVKTLPQAQLVHAGNGLYNVRAGNTLVTNTAGQRIFIQVAP